MRRPNYGTPHESLPDMTLNPPLFCELACCFSAFVTVRRSQPDADSDFIDLKPQTALPVIVGLLAHLPELGGIGQKPFLQFGIVSADLCCWVFGIVI